MGFKGYIQIYTGNGKGKTTAAIGLAIRAAGAGLKVLFTQFVKGDRYSEIKAFDRYNDLITVEQYGTDCFIFGEPSEEDVTAARDGLAKVREHFLKSEYQVVILDEANIALHYKLFTVEELLDVIDVRSAECEVVITGRNAPQVLVDAADLVTEMREVKHYYTNGVRARIGIEK
jgi:cob(I)alamin adenosyltransferase